ncbi:MAG: pitrilysin family protein [Bacteroidia bacterium]|nr:pitrilysin family protein [Bacteroidia bacterium]
MKIPDRTKQPAVQKIENINLSKPQELKLNGKIPVYIIHGGEADVIRIDVIFEAGLWFHDKTLVAPITNSMLTEGTKQYSSAGIAEKIDYYGAYLNTECNNDTASVSLLCLKKYLPETLGILENVVSEALFPENELSILINNRKQGFIIEGNKVKVLAQRKFLLALFGENHPYGQKAEAGDFDTVSKSQLVEFYKHQYSTNNCRIIVSGNADDESIKNIESCFGIIGGNSDVQIIDPKHVILNTKPGKYFIEKEEAVQSAIRIGKIMVNRHHPDFPGLMVMNTLLGGYFGSRLMTNIREDKGYTYGIGSGLISLRHSAYFFIATEVASEVCKDAINEIYSEIKKLQSEEIPKDELDRVRSYMLGDLLRDFDGPFAQADIFRILSDNGQDYRYYENIVKTINTIQPFEINELALKYLHTEDMFEVIAGKIY